MVATDNPTILEARSRGVYPTDKPLSPTTPGPDASFGGAMHTEELLEILNEDAIKRGKHGSNYEPEYEPDDVDEKIIDAGGPETDEEREARND